MVNLYNQVSYKCSREITHAYSTSFTLGIRTLDKAYHKQIYAIYGFVRLADEIVDTFHEYDKADLIDEFETDTRKAVNSGISLNPVLHAFQDVVNNYQIPWEHIDAFLHSMRMDLTYSAYDSPLFREYIYGSAEVVGLMCLKVFCNGNDKQYEKLVEPAKKLGAAFQKVNFLRDMKSDYYERGRIYFPGVVFEEFDNTTKQQIEQDIEKDFEKAYQGILKLNVGVRLGVYMAFVYYKALFRKIKKLPASEVLDKRVRVPDVKKAYLMIESYIKNSLNYI